MARVLLAVPPDAHDLEIYRVTGINAPPLGLAYIASVLEALGHKVAIVDTPTLKMRLKQFLAIVKEFKPDVIGLSILTPLALKAYRAIKAIKDAFKDIAIVCGGPHATFVYEEVLRNGADVVVRGEGEETTGELINVIEKYGVDENRLMDVKGIAFVKHDGRVVVTENRPLINNLDALPFPARHLLPMDKYTLFGKPIRVAHVMASRGCPYGCIFCSTSYFWGRRFRFRSAKNVADEVEELVTKYRARYIVFTDDELIVNRKFIYDFIKEIRERKLDIVFTAGARVDHVDREYLKFLYDNGCVALYFGVESGSQETLNRIGKGIKIEQAEKVFEWIKELKGFAAGSFVLGFPWEKKDDLENTIKFAIKLDPSYAQFTVATPYPGTPLYYYALRNNLIVDHNWEHFTTLQPVMRGFYLDINTIREYLRKAYYKFYVRANFILREWKAGRVKDIFRIIVKEVGNYFLEKIRNIL